MRRSVLSQAQIRYALAERRPDVIIPFEPALHAAATGEAQDRPPGKAYRQALRELALSSLRFSTHSLGTSLSKRPRTSFR